jgi:hypothetical protein
VNPVFFGRSNGTSSRFPQVKGKFSRLVVAKCLDTVSIQRHLSLSMSGSRVLKRSTRMLLAGFVVLLSVRLCGAMSMRRQVVKFGGTLVVLVV